MPNTPYKTMKEYTKEYSERRRLWIIKMREKYSDQRIAEKLGVTRQNIHYLVGPRTPKTTEQPKEAVTE